MHEGPDGGHFGVSRIQNKLCGKYFWPTMVEDVKYYVKTCKRCQRMNISSLLKPKLSFEADPSSFKNIRSDRNGFDTYEPMQRIQLYNNSC